jgi:hypothetical protein
MTGLASEDRACDRYQILLCRGHMEIGVKFDTNNQRFKEAAAEALNYWAGQLDLVWSEDSDDRTCSIEFRPAEFGVRADSHDMLAMAHLPDHAKYDGVVYFRLLAHYDAQRVFVHELGHLFGLEHSDTRSSPMYFQPENAGVTLTSSELKQLAKRHKLALALVAEDGWQDKDSNTCLPNPAWKRK